MTKNYIADITFLLRVDDKHLNVQSVFADSSFLIMFNFPLTNGNVLGRFTE